MPAVEPAVPTMPVVEPIAPVVPEIPAMPAVEPTVPTMPVVEPIAPVVPEIPAMPAVQPVVPTMPVAEPIAPVIPPVDENPEEPSSDGGVSIPASPVMEVPSVFETAPTITPIVAPATSIAPMPTTPIVEESLPSKFLDTVEVPAAPVEPVVEETPVVNELAEAKLEEKTDEIKPIIITDYTKQYDPVIPTAAPAPEKVDFKQIINLIRDVNSTIEKCGYSIETEEYDLEGVYQVIFKINKN